MIFCWPVYSPLITYHTPGPGIDLWLVMDWKNAIDHARSLLQIVLQRFLSISRVKANDLLLLVTYMSVAMQTSP